MFVDVMPNSVIENGAVISVQVEESPPAGQLVCSLLFLSHTHILNHLFFNSIQTVL